MSGFLRLLGRFGRDESGVFAVVFGIMAIVLIALGGAVVDYVSLEQTRARAQTALDAAALALQPDINQLPEQTIRERAEALVLERIGDASVSARVDRIDIDPENGRLYLAGSFSMPTIFVRLVGVSELGSNFASEAIKGSANVEVSLALDVTGSMAGGRIEALKTATKELIETILEGNQGENYAKVALVPYSQAVNAGAYAEALRGPIRPIRTVQAINWSTGTSKAITNASKEYPVRITAANHGFQVNDWVYITSVEGMRQINDRAFRVASRNASSFTLDGVDGRSYSNYSRNGSVIKCLVSNCDAVVTSNEHSFSTGDALYFQNLRGITNFNNKLLTIGAATTNTFTLPGVAFTRSNSYVANSGRFFCTWQNATEGCPFYRFANRFGNMVMNELTTCVTERPVNPFNDQPPSVTYVGRNYPNSGNGCLKNAIVPLTDDEDTLFDAVEAFAATGSTSGSLGALWGWYMLSPNFGYVWPEESRPAPYREEHLLKAVIIMTDGEFNTVHNDGVVAQNSTDGSSVYWDRSDYIGRDAHNGSPYAQAEAYCDAMNAPNTGIVVYTVGFGIQEGSNAANVLAYCARNPKNFFLAENASDLRDSFQQIARNISALRLSQ